MISKTVDGITGYEDQDMPVSFSEKNQSPGFSLEKADITDQDDRGISIEMIKNLDDILKD
ncbi:MAG: hypothetical protein HQ517_09690 [SAR324 cluster bacterium]|nr:hypothetical protein [SAR324 cluster bacterium]